MAVPVLAGAVQETRRLVAPAEATDGAAGRPGLALGVPLPEGDQAPSPAPLPARTCTLWARPVAKPVMVVEVPVPAKEWLVQLEADERL